ncbi:unnamed protein product [Urochloa humidicola]
MRRSSAITPRIQPATVPASVLAAASEAGGAMQRTADASGRAAGLETHVPAAGDDRPGAELDGATIFGSTSPNSSSQRDLGGSSGEAVLHLTVWQGSS